MYSGEIVEKNDVYSLFATPLHPYTRGLLQSIPKIDGREKTLYSIPGEVPDLITLPKGCNFAPRCNYAKQQCWERKPELEAIDENQSVACLRFREIHG